MAFPQILGTSKGVNGSNTTSHNITLPTSIAAGELIVVMMAFDGNAGLAGGWPVGYIGHYQDNTTNGTPSALMLYKRAVGNEGGTTITVNSVNTEQSSYVAMRLSVGTIASFQADNAFFTGNGTNISFNSGGSNLIPARDYTFISFRAGDGSTQPTTPSSNYTLVDSQAGGGTGASVYVQKRELNSQSDTPAANTMTVATEQWVSMQFAFFFDSFTFEKQNDLVVIQSTPTGAEAFSFASNGLNLKKVFIQQFVGATTGNSYIELYAHSGVFGTSGIPTGSALATSQTLAVTGNQEYGMCEYTFATPYQTTNGTNYFIRVVNTGGVSHNYYGAPGGEGNTASFSGGIWTPSSTNYRPPFILLSTTSGVSGTITETTTGTESQSVTATFARSISETATASDLTDETLQTSASITEAASASDTTDGSKGQVAADITEAGAGTDSQVVSATFPRSITEAGSGSDSVTATATFQGSISEPGSGTDSITVSGTFPVAISEAVTASDSVSSTLTASRSITESTTATEVQDFTTGTISGSVSESAVASDSVTVAGTFSGLISETTTATDSITVSAVFSSSLSELGSATDTVTRSATYPFSISEAGSGQDSISAGNFVSVSISDGTTAGETATAIFVVAVTASETASASESQSSQKIASGQVQESAGAVDSVSRTAVLSGTLSEPGAASDSVSVTYITTRSASEGAAATDSIVGSLSLSGSISEGASASDSWSGTVISGVSYLRSAKIVYTVSGGSVFSDVKTGSVGQVFTQGSVTVTTTKGRINQDLIYGTTKTTTGS